MVSDPNPQRQGLAVTPITLQAERIGGTGDPPHVTDTGSTAGGPTTREQAHEIVQRYELARDLAKFLAELDGIKLVTASEFCRARYLDHAKRVRDFLADREANFANARLIAAAPEMYDLLREYLSPVDAPPLMDVIDRTETLLARIDGVEHA